MLASRMGKLTPPRANHPYMPAYTVFARLRRNTLQEALGESYEVHQPKHSGVPERRQKNAVRGNGTAGRSFHLATRVLNETAVRIVPPAAPRRTVHSAARIGPRFLQRASGSHEGRQGGADPVLRGARLTGGSRLPSQSRSEPHSGRFPDGAQSCLVMRGHQ